MKKYTIGAVIGLIIGANFGVWVEGEVRKSEDKIKYREAIVLPQDVEAK